MGVEGGGANTWKRELSHNMAIETRPPPMEETIEPTKNSESGELQIANEEIVPETESSESVINSFETQASSPTITSQPEILAVVF